MGLKDENTIFCRNLPYTLTNENLRKFFEDKYGEKSVAHAIIVKDEKGESKGYGFVEFKLSLEAKKAAQELNGQELEGRKLQIDLFKKKKETPAGKKGGEPQEKKEKNAEIVLHGLNTKRPHAEMLQTLTNLFSKVGKIVNIRLPLSKMQEGMHRGFAFILFRKETSAAMAVKQFNGRQIEGTEITVDRKLALEDYNKIKDAITHGKRPESTSNIDGDDEYVDKPGQTETEEDDKAMEGLVEENEDGGVDDSDDEDDQELVEEDDEEEEEPEQKKPAKSTKQEDKKKKEKAKPAVNDDIMDYDNYLVDDANEEAGEADGEEKAADDSNESDAEEKDEDEAKPKRQKWRDPTEINRTVFVRNLPFEITSEQLQPLFAKFGDVDYVLVVKNKKTGMSNGTAFVKYKKQEGMDKLMKEMDISARLLHLDEIAKQKMLGDKKEGARGEPVFKAGEGTVEGVEISGRKLYLSKAISRERAEWMKQQKDIESKKDKRNIHLAKEGFIRESKRIPKEMVKKFQESLRRKEKLLKENPNFHISDVRLCVHNVPKNMSEKELRTIFLEGATKYKSDEVETEAAPKIVQAKIVKEKGNKVANNKLNKSKGFAFIQFEQHEHALAALRALNAKPGVISNEPNRLLFIEFALENALKVQKLKNSMQKGKKFTELAKTMGKASTKKPFAPKKKFAPKPGAASSSSNNNAPKKDRKNNKRGREESNSKKSPKPKKQRTKK